jgi:hypothetical protein
MGICIQVSLLYYNASISRIPLLFILVRYILTPEIYQGQAYDWEIGDDDQGDHEEG